MGRRFLVAAAVLAAVAFVAGCGGEAEVSTAITAPPSSSPTAEEPVATSATGSAATAPDQQSDSDSTAGDPAGGSDVVGYCADLVSLVGLLGSGGNDEDYDALLSQVMAEGPPAHTKTWRLMLTVSAEPFSYENFNPAVDSFETIAPDLVSRCDGLETMIVNGDGRLTRLEDR